LQWLVLRDVIDVTAAQIDQMKFISGLDSSFRDPMPLNGRAVNDGSEIGHVIVQWFVIMGYCTEVAARQFTPSVGAVLGLSAEEMVIIQLFDAHGREDREHKYVDVWDVYYLLNVTNNTKTFIDRFLENVGVEGSVNENMTAAIRKHYNDTVGDVPQFFAGVRATVIYSSFHSSDNSPDTWSYPYNATEWGRISATCVEGTSQSPVDLLTHSGVEQTELIVRPRIPVDVSAASNQSLTWNINAENLPVLFFGEKSYALSYVQCHIGSEHTVEGLRYPGSCHFFYRLGNEYVAMAILIDDKSSNENAAFDDLLYNVQLDLDTLISGLDLRYYWEYRGSFTTPDCDEDLQWLVLRDVIDVTAAQIDQMKFISGLDSSFRDPMPLNGRAVNDGSEIGHVIVQWFVIMGYCTEVAARQFTPSVGAVLGLSAEEMVITQLFDAHGREDRERNYVGNWDVYYLLNVTNNTKTFIDRFLENVGVKGIANENVTEAIRKHYNDTLGDVPQYFSGINAIMIYSSFHSSDNSDSVDVGVIIAVVIASLLCIGICITFYLRKKKIDREIAVEIVVDGNTETSTTKM